MPNQTNSPSFEIPRRHLLSLDKKTRHSHFELGNRDIREFAESHWLPLAGFWLLRKATGWLRWLSCYIDANSLIEQLRSPSVARGTSEHTETSIINSLITCSDVDYLRLRNMDLKHRLHESRNTYKIYLIHIGRKFKKHIREQ